MLRAISLLLALIISLGASVFLGENPFEVAKILIYGAFGTPTNIGYTLFYATPLIFTGLSVRWGLKSGLFNIGSEGQMTIAGVFSTWLALDVIQDGGHIGIFGIILCAALSGALWGGVAGWLKSYRNTHEVLSTILLNFISYGVASYLIFHVLKDAGSQIPETTLITETLWLPVIFPEVQSSPLNVSFCIALFVTLFMFLYDRHSISSFRQRLTGSVPRAAQMAGINTKASLFLTLAISGALAGMASLNNIFGYVHRAREGFAAGAGFVGIAVALLARNSYFGILLSAIFFGALHKGSLDLDIDTSNITRDFSIVIQALIILVVTSQDGVEKFLRKFR